MKIPDRSYPSDLPDMLHEEIEWFLVMLQRFQFWHFFSEFFWHFGYLEMNAIDNYHFMGSLGKYNYIYRCKQTFIYHIIGGNFPLHFSCHKWRFGT